MSTRSHLRVVASAAEESTPTLRMRDTSSSETRRLAAFVRRLHVRYYAGDIVLGFVGGVLLMLAALTAGLL